jgi:SAM-dependent methyltransferase
MRLAIHLPLQYAPSPMRRLRTWLGQRWNWLGQQLEVLRRPSRPEGFHAYWLSPEHANLPSAYLAAGRGRSEFLVDYIGRNFDGHTSIFEVGCNAGRNLHHLHRAGFTNLQALEINPAAVALLRGTYPELAGAQIHVSPVEGKIKDFPDNAFDLTFTMAVLEHIHAHSEWVFAEIARTCKHLLTIEDEHSDSSRTFPRNYRQVFEGLGLRQVEELRGLPDLPEVFVLRRFRKD